MMGYKTELRRRIRSEYHSFYSDFWANPKIETERNWYILNSSWQRILNSYITFNILCCVECLTVSAESKTGCQVCYAYFYRRLFYIESVRKEGNFFLWWTRIKRYFLICIMKTSLKFFWWNNGIIQGTFNANWA